MSVTRLLDGSRSTKHTIGVLADTPDIDPDFLEEELGDTPGVNPPAAQVRPLPSGLGVLQCVLQSINNPVHGTQVHREGGGPREGQHIPEEMRGGGVVLVSDGNGTLNMALLVERYTEGLVF